jgi:predicted HicB family RNase H-like nuclease
MTRGRPPKGVDYIPRGRASYRFPPELLKKIKQAARLKKVSQNAYVEQALRNQLKADGIFIKS